jgi:hypothetical protein
MTVDVDMTNNRVPYGLLTDEEKAALHEHKKAGGEFLFKAPNRGLWQSVCGPWWCVDYVYRTVPLPAQRSEQSSLKTQDTIAWEKLPDRVEWVARDANGEVNGYVKEPYTDGYDDQWLVYLDYARIDDFPGIVMQIGTCDWRDSKQRRPK